ncbi:MAG: TonB-dependent receptor [Byssovorax sp.]
MRALPTALFALALLGHAPALRAQGAGAQQEAPRVVIPPRPREALRADYPEGAIGDATVLLKIVVNADGSLGSAEVLEGPEPFAAAAVAASPRWTFEPATRDGKPIKAAIKAVIRFVAPAPLGPPTPDLLPAPGAPPAPNDAGAASTQSPPSPPPPPPIEVTIQGEIPAPGAISISRAEVRLLPGAFGDPFRAVELLPGVTPIASGVPFFYVRGAPPGNVGYFLDGVRVPLLYHLGLGPAVIHPALIDRVDLYPGGYPARYGRFAGGVVAGETKEPRPEWHAEANLRLVDAGALIEAPFDGGRGTATVGGRYSYTAALLSLTSSAIDLRYWDYQGRVTYDLTPRDRVSVLAFGAYDFLGQREDGASEVRFSPVTKRFRFHVDAPVSNILFDTTFHRVDLRYEHRFGPESSVQQAVTVGYDQTRLDEGRFARDTSFSARTTVKHRFGDGPLLRAGADVVLDDNKVDLVRGSPDSFTSLFVSRKDLAVGFHGEALFTFGPRLEVTPGLRVDLYGSRGKTQMGVDPRLSARVEVEPWLHFVPALGLASQTPSFILPGPGFSLGIGGPLQRSAQSSLGVEMDLPEEVKATATVFYNVFFSMSDGLGTARASASSFDPAFGRRADGTGYGLELTLHRRLTKKLGGFISYTLSHTNRVIYRPYVLSVVPEIRVATLRTNTPSTFDRTHVFNAALSYDIGRGFRAGARFVFYTGYPKVYGPSDGLSIPVVTNDRLQPFFRLDLRAEKKWTIAERYWLSLVLEVQNATLSKEVLGQSCEDGVCTDETIGPVVIPSLGLEGGF